MRRFLTRAGSAVALLAISAGLWILWNTRDRNPGYTLDLRVRPDPLRAARDLRAGFGRRTITPDLSRAVWLAGFATGRRATTVHDDLWAMATVIDDGEHRLGVVVLDAIGLFHDDVIAIRKRVAASTPLDYLIVASTHNHSTPDLMGLWGPRAGFSGVDKAYLSQVILAASSAVVDAAAALAPAQVSLHELPLPTDGLVADSRDPQVFDATLRLMHFSRPSDGTTIGSIVNWADHPETPWADNTEITADFPGYLRDALEHGVTVSGRTIAGLGGTHLYVNGAIGGLMTTSPEIRVTDPFEGKTYQLPSHDKARALGRRLAEAILAALQSGRPAPETQPRLSVTARTIELSLDNRLFRLASAVGLIARGQPRWHHLRSEIALVGLGGAQIVCVPGELYPEIANGGIAQPEGADFGVVPQEVPPLRDLMPGRVKFLFGLANDEVGYIIPKSEWDDRPPWLYGVAERHYGEINSLGPNAGPELHGALKALIERASEP